MNTGMSLGDTAKPPRPVTNGCMRRCGNALELITQWAEAAHVGRSRSANVGCGSGVHLVLRHQKSRLRECSIPAYPPERAKKNHDSRIRRLLRKLQREAFHRRIGHGHVGPHLGYPRAGDVGAEKTPSFETRTHRGDLASIRVAKQHVTGIVGILDKAAERHAVRIDTRHPAPESRRKRSKPISRQRPALRSPLFKAIDLQHPILLLMRSKRTAARRCP